jgi:hypothetical protein
MALVGLWLQKAIVKIDAVSGESLLGTATGFIVDHNNGWYLVSAWHVFSGRDPRTGQPMNKEGCVPDRFNLTFNVLAIDLDGTTTGVTTKKIGVPLNTEGGEAIWSQHAVHGQAVDVAVINLTDCLSWFQTQMYSGSSQNMVADVGCDLFMPSFPKGYSANGVFPITKRASLANPIDNFTGGTAFYIDTASREGMSGAPVFIWTNVAHWVQDSLDCAPKFTGLPFAYRLLGVYSGREISSDVGDAQIGRVFKEYLIPEIINNGSKGSFELVSS